MGGGEGGEEKGSYSPSALSLFRPEMPDTQATLTLVIKMMFTCMSLLL